MPKEKAPAGTPGRGYVAYASETFRIPYTLRRKKPRNPLRFSNTTTFIETPPYPLRSTDTPSATRMTAQINSVSPVGQKHDSDIPIPKLTAHIHRHGRLLKQELLKFGFCIFCASLLGLTLQYIQRRKIV